MKKHTIIIVSILLACGISTSTLAQNADTGKNQPAFKFEKLSKNDIKKFFKKETKMHRLGQVTVYTDLPADRLHKETTYGNKDGKLVFYYERGHKYDEKDSLVYQYQYSEIPSHEYPELIEYQHIYPSDSLSISVQTIGDHQLDSTFIFTKKNELDQIIEVSEIANRTYKGETYPDKSNITNYFYNNSGELIQKLEIQKKDGDTLQTNYEYENHTLKKRIFTNEYNKNISIYKNGLVDSDEDIYDTNPELNSKTFYTYNDKKQEILSKKYEQGKLVYSYKSFYDEKGLKTKYEMLDEIDGDSGIWLFEYDENGEILNEIDLFYRDELKKNKPEKIYRIETPPSN